MRELSGADPAVVPNWISMAEIEAVPVAEHDVDVLFVGRLIPEKNADLVVEAVEGIGPDVTGVIVGDGPERDRGERLIDAREVGDRVTVIGPLERYEEVLGLMKAADVFVSPAREEGFGMTVAEAIAARTPVVATRVSGVGRLLDDEVERRELVSEGRRRAKQFSWETAAEQTEAGYRLVTGD